MRPSPGAGAGADTPTGGTMEKASKCVQGWGGVGRGGGLSEEEEEERDKCNDSRDRD